MRSHRLIFASFSVLACSGETVGTGTDIGNGGESVENNCVRPTSTSPGQYTVDCDELIENGCETNILTDIENCGGCGIICDDVNGTPICVDGKCDSVCIKSFIDCKGDYRCETNTATSVNNCGECDNVCPSNQGVPWCHDSECGWTACDVGTADCDGNGTCETDLNTSDKHCGSCGNMCDGESNCINKSCKIVSAGTGGNGTGGVGTGGSGTNTGGLHTGGSTSTGGSGTGGSVISTGGLRTGGTSTGGSLTGGTTAQTGGGSSDYNCTASTNGTCGIQYAFQCVSTPPGDCTAVATASVYCCADPCAPANITQSSNCKEEDYSQPYVCYGNQIPNNCVASSIANIACCPNTENIGDGGASGVGGTNCDETTATDLGAFSNTKTSVPANGCVMVTNYPTWWDTSVLYLKIESNISYPIPFVWENICSGTNGEGTFTEPSIVELGYVSDECATLIDFGGSDDSIVELYWQNSNNLDCLGGEYLSGTCQAVKLANGDNLFDVAVDETYAYFVSYQENGYVAKVPLVGGEVVILATEQNGPARIAVNETHVFWTSYLGGTVNQILKSGGTTETIGTYTSPLGIEVNNTHIYWADNTDNGTIYRKSLSGESVEIITNTASWAWGLTLDNDAIYYTTYGASAVYFVPFIGGNPVFITNTQDYPTAITMADNILYWVSSNNIESVSSQGGVVTTLTSNHKPYGIAINGNNVYFTDDDEKAVLMVPKSGGESIPVAINLVKPQLMTADEVSVLWADFSEDAVQGGIYRLAVNN